eukprot:scaffold71244_cov65-Phaeocystis_antarctica.AAC.7
MLGSPRPPLVDADEEFIHLRKRRWPHHAVTEARATARSPRSPGIILIVSDGRSSKLWRHQWAALSVSGITSLSASRSTM